MQKTIYCCDICERPTNYGKDAMIGRGFIAHYQIDWTMLPSPKGDQLVCSDCNTVLRRAQKLGITLPEPSDTICVGGPFYISPAADS